MGSSYRLYSVWLAENLQSVCSDIAARPYIATYHVRQRRALVHCRRERHISSCRRLMSHSGSQDVTTVTDAALHIASDNSCTDHEELLRRIQSGIDNHLDSIVWWLRTNRHTYVRDVDNSIIHLLRNAEQFAALHGLLLCDVPASALKSHVKSARRLRDLFSPKFIEEQKAILYRHQNLPLLKNQDVKYTSDIEGHYKGNEQEIGHADQNYVNYKRQVLIERQSFAEALETARVEASSLMELEKPSELPALSHTCDQWVHDIASFIEQDRRKNVDSVLPSVLDEYTLARATVNIALQLMCFPAYALNSKGHKGGLLRRRPQQTAGNQVLLAHAAIRLGDEVGRIYARKMAEISPSIKAICEPKIEFPVNAESIPVSQTETVVGINSTTSEKGDGGVFSLTRLVRHGLGAMTASAFSAASSARVISNTSSGMFEPTPQLHSDGTLTDDQKQWNSKQSAAVGGYLLHALVQSCYVQVDLTTALRQTNTFAELDPSLLLPDITGQDTEQKAIAKKKKMLSKAVNRIRQSRFDEGKVEIAAFGHKVHRHGVKVYGVLEMKECCMIHLRDAVARGLVNLSCLPMVCEPKPWTSVSSGGLALLKHYFIRTQNRPTFDVRVYDLSRVLNVVTEFGKVPWMINNKVLKTLKTLWTADAVMPMRSFLPNKTLVETDPSTLSNPMERANALSEYSLFERRLRVADDFAMEPRIYFPQNIDFRGRMYPLSPHLNHMADDVCRSLLKFADKRPLGERGFFWLKVHLSNLHGLDKVPFSDRIAWVENNTDLIKQLVKSPFSDVSQSFWSRMESPFQFFAAANEYVAAINSGDPFSYLSDVPIHQDGTCNGLQHYAALGRDLKGAGAVNLLPSEKPQDVYQQVLLEVITKVRADYQNLGMPYKDQSNQRAQYAKICLEQGILRRKIVKQTVMTICYGVTRMGAVAQIENRLKEIPSLEPLGAQTLRQLASYIAGKVLGSIKTVFAEAMSIKKWLDDISAAHNRLNVPVTWITPMGLPCEQPYCKAVTKVVRTPIQAINVSEQAPSIVDKRRQKLAFPPNFVHSLDASHLMLTAESLFKRDISFAAVHDSYWTHACNVDLMNSELREHFIKMYEEPILENLYNSCNKRLRGEVIIAPPPPRGKLDLRHVKESQYFFH